MAATTIISGITKTVKFNRLNKDYDCFVSIDGDTPQYLGSAATHRDAEMVCDAFAYDYLSDTNTPEAAVQVALAMTEAA